MDIPAREMSAESGERSTWACWRSTNPGQFSVKIPKSEWREINTPSRQPAVLCKNSILVTAPGQSIACGAQVRASNPFRLAKDFALILESALRDLHDAGLDVVDQSMFAVDAPGPESKQVPLHRLRSTQSSKRMALNVFDQRVDLVAHANIGTRPVEIILPGTRCPDYSHPMSLCGRPRPAFKSRTALPSRAAFLGLENR